MTGPEYKKVALLSVISSSCTASGHGRNVFDGTLSLERLDSFPSIAMLRLWWTR
ncbi:hypothetical protein EJ03DRAFT_332303 [Teratosphaeria nubilosa]|uniref:Uncharacterized protein n=1 Tax=Teratosphaeria nubilosa TaxID=161662 RepID=A0A6G1KTF2_9PEZI|nr:hypothetical protein EJ03DRAFT_332303 [Teratosphaeria nubilosa]